MPAGGVVAVVLADEDPWVRVWLPAPGGGAPRPRSPGGLDGRDAIPALLARLAEAGFPGATAAPDAPSLEDAFVAASLVVDWPAQPAGRAARRWLGRTATGRAR